MPALDVDAVKNLASKRQYRLVQDNAESRVLGFVPAHGKTVQGCTIKRVQVWYTTGTVSTAIEHPTKGATQLFRLHNTLASLAEIFQNPRVHTGVGYYTREQRTGIEQATGTRERSPRRTTETTENDEEQAMKLQLERTQASRAALVKEHEAQLAVLDADIASLKTGIGAFEAKREAEAKQKREAEEAKAKQKREAEEAKAKQKREADEAERKNAERRARGKGASWAGLNDNDFIYSAWGETVVDVAIGDTTTVLLYEGGGFTYTSGLTPKVHNKLHSRPAHAPAPSVINLGSGGRYFMQFTNGKCEAMGPQSLYDALDELGASTIKLVAFGEWFDSWFILQNDYGWRHSGVIPEGLACAIEQQGSRYKGYIEFVSLGPSGEYFVEFSDGWQCCELGQSSLSVTQWKRNGGKRVWFGADGSYLMRY